MANRKDRRRAAKEITIFKVSYSDQVADLLGDTADRVVAELMKVAFAKLPVPVVMGSHLLVVTMKGNGADLEFGIELDLINKTAEIAFRHESDQDIWNRVLAGSELQPLLLCQCPGDRPPIPRSQESLSGKRSGRPEGR
jgi:hypothetical protein